MKPFSTALEFTAHIADGDSGALIFPDIETCLDAGIEQGEVCVDKVYLRDYNQREAFFAADGSADPFVQRLAAIIREQAVADDDFVALVHERHEDSYEGKNTVFQRRLRAKNVF